MLGDTTVMHCGLNGGLESRYQSVLKITAYKVKQILIHRICRCIGRRKRRREEEFNVEQVMT